MQKRGSVIINYLIMLILAIIVLVVVLIIFTKGFDALFDNIRGILRMVFSTKPKGL